MIFNKHRSYAVYIQYLESGKTSCHITYERDAGRAWSYMYAIIKNNNDQGKVWIVDVKRVD